MGEIVTYMLSDYKFLRIVPLPLIGQNEDLVLSLWKIIVLKVKSFKRHTKAKFCVLDEYNIQRDIVEDEMHNAFYMTCQKIPLQAPKRFRSYVYSLSIH